MQTCNYSSRRRMLLRSMLTVMFVLMAASAGPGLFAQIVVDDFNTGAFSVTGPYSFANNVPASGAIGGARDVIVDDLSLGAPSVMSLSPGNGYLNLAVNTSSGKYQIGWGSSSLFLSVADLNLNASSYDRIVVTLSQAPTSGQLMVYFNRPGDADEGLVVSSLNGAGDYTFLFTHPNLADVNTSDIDGISIIFFSGVPAGSTIRVESVTIGAPQRNLSINNVSLNEGDAGATSFDFTVSLDLPAGTGGVTFDIATADNTAQDDNPVGEDNDYVAQSLTGQTIVAGNSTYSFSVTVNGDLDVEPNETFFVNVSNVVGATLGDGQGLGTITNDDVAAAATTTTITSSLNPSFTGNTVTFTATVTSSGNPVTSGTVTFSEGATVWGAPVALNASGQAGFSTSSLTEGSHNITATYNGAAGFATSNGSVTQTVNNPTSVNGNEFCNTLSGITINDNSPATPYPSRIFVSGVSGTITKLTVSLYGFTTTAAADVDLLLVGPGGQKFILLSDVGSSGGASNVDLILDDAAASSLPASLASGTFRPTDNAPADVFPASAPAGPYTSAAPTGAGTFAGIFGGTNPNGTWSLYVVDDAAPTGGSIAGGWCLNITTTPPPPTVKPFVFVANKVTLKSTKQNTPAGDIHSNGLLVVEKGKPSTYNSNLTAVGKITIQKQNTINGDVTSQTSISNSGTINGTPSVGPVDNEPLPSLSYSAGGLNKTVPKGKSLTLAPGSYGIVTMSNNGTLKLTSGEYFFNELRYSSSIEGGKIEINLSSGNPITINVMSNLQLGHEAAIVLLPNGESDSHLVTFNTKQTTNANWGREAYLLGSFNAPNAVVTLVKNTQLRGSIYAKEILVSNDCLFLHHDSPGSLPGPGDLPKSSFDEDEEEVTSGQSPVTSYELSQNYPNPFNPSTTISFALPQAGEVTLSIYNTNGQLVKRLVGGTMNAGRHSFTWDATNERGERVASGVYLYVIKAGDPSAGSGRGFTAQKKLVLMK